MHLDQNVVMSIREATPTDIPEILAMIHELAAYEKAPNEVIATPGLLREALFGPDPAVFALMAVDDRTGDVVGFALTRSRADGRVDGVSGDGRATASPRRGRRVEREAGLDVGLGVGDGSRRAWPERRDDARDCKRDEGDPCAALDPAFCGRQGHAHDKGKELPDDEKAARPATCAPQATRGNHHGGSEETEDRDLQPDRHRTGHLGRPSDAQTGNLHSDVGGVGQQGHALDRRNSGTDDQ